MTPTTPIVVLLGVSGSGKSKVGAALAEALHWPLIEGDDYHPQANVDKMAQGIPLTDKDRAPWLAYLHNLIANNVTAAQPAIVTCSALKQIYRDQLQLGIEGVVFVYLRGDYELILSRMKARRHFFKPAMLQSQFDALEEPADAIAIEIDAAVETIVDRIVHAANLQG